MVTTSRDITRILGLSRIPCGLSVWAKEVTRDISDRTPSDLTDEELLEAILTSGARLMDRARQKNAEMGSLTDDPRWEAPTPLRFEVQLASLFFGALDAFDVTAAILRRRASQQAFNGLRFQMETVPLIRWMSEPTEPGERQERAYRVLCGQITRYAKFLMEDAGRDRDALQGVHAVRRWGERLREIAKQDGIEHLQRELGRRELFDKYFPKSGYPIFSMYSELGSHPGAFGNLLFSLRPESREINYDLGQALVARAFWSSAALVFLWQTCEAIAKALGWDDWLREVVPIFNGAGPLMSETARRRNALM
jgi:hypothetical protein